MAIFTLIVDGKLYAVLRTRDAQKAYEYPIKAADLNRKIFEFHQLEQDPELDPRPLAQELYKIPIGGMAGDLRQAGAQTPMWPPTARFDTYRWGRCTRVSVMTLASNTRLKDLPDRKWKAAGFGVTKGFEDASALPLVSSELAGIKTTRPGDGGVLAGEIKLDDQFRQQSVRQKLLKRYPVVHIWKNYKVYIIFVMATRRIGPQTKNFGSLQVHPASHPAPGQQRTMFIEKALADFVT